MKDYSKLDYEKKRVKKSKRTTQIVVLGSSKAICTKEAYNMAFEVGQELAKRGVVTMTGGGHGVMEATLKGAKLEGGLTIAIIPWENLYKVNDYADYVVATGIGWSRNSININSADGCIVIHGGAGTLNEATYAYMMEKPVVALTPSGGVAEEISDRFFDVRETESMVGVSSPKEAVEKILKLVGKRSKKDYESQKDNELLDAEESKNRHVKIKNKDAKNKSK
ncbi:MAG: TIGR00725 family protein [Candidatus Woesearchaeota archaeon]